MIEITLFERLKLTFDLIFSSPLFLILIVAFSLMLLDIYFVSKKSKRVETIYLIISLIVIVLLLQNYFDSLFNVLDTIAKNIVTIIYFPSVLEYILIIIISLIILLFGTFNKKTNSKIKLINLIVFSLNIFIFFLILDQISVNEIDLSDKVSIYSNENLMALFELSVIIFAIWIIFLILYKIIKKLTVKEDNTSNFYEEPELPKTIEELRKEELVPPPQIEYIVVEKKNDNDMFTLDEYRQMKKILEYMKNNKE